MISTLRILRILLHILLPRVPCMAQNAAGFICTDPKGHEGEHRADAAPVGSVERIVARWE